MALRTSKLGANIRCCPEFLTCWALKCFFSLPEVTQRMYLFLKQHCGSQTCPLNVLVQLCRYFFPRLSIHIQLGVSAHFLKTRHPFCLTALNPQASARECGTVGDVEKHMWNSGVVGGAAARSTHSRAGVLTLRVAPLSGSVLDPAFKAWKSSSLFY